MSVGEYVRWCAFLRMRQQGTTPSTPGTGESKIGKFRAKLAKLGFYKHTGYRK